MKKPNILILFTDQQRADTIGALGNELIQTPALDRLVKEGTAFIRCYSPSPVCISARCSLQYGLYPQSTGLAMNGRMMDDNGRSYPELLSAAGYRTAAIGKCHFTPEANALRGFDERITQEELCSDYAEDDYRTWLKENGFNPCEPYGERGPMYYIPQTSRWAPEQHPSQWIGDRTIEWIDAQGEQPWCLFSSFIHPHPPFSLPMPWNKLYRADDMPLPFVPDSAESLYTHINRTQNRYKWRDNGTDLNLIRCMRAYYYAAISFVDFQIGRILKTLEKSGELDNTLILFSADHGEYLGDYGCVGKRSMHDVAARIPMLARLPGTFDAGQVCAEPVSLVDVLPTALAAAGDNCAEAVDGEDLAGVAGGSSARKVVFSQWGAESRNMIYMAASRDWKYIYSAGEHKEILFDRKTDPRESRNAADRPGCAAVKEELKQALFDYLGFDPDVVETVDGMRRWKKKPPLTQNYLTDNPDAGVLFQDEPDSLFAGIDGYHATRDPAGYTPAYWYRMFFGD